MKYFFSIVIVSLVARCGYPDYKRSESKRLVGGIYIVNLNLPEEPYDYLVFLDKTGREVELLKQPDALQSVVGNDSILLAHATTDTVSHYYAIFHQHGDTILNSSELTRDSYLLISTQISKRYSFHAEVEE